MVESVPTRWAQVWLLFSAGCTSAFHIGKIPAALPELSRELSLSLFESSWIVALFSISFAVLGLTVSVYAARACRAAATTGFVLAGVASAAGMWSHAAVPLMVSRVGEGIGWILVAVTIPVLIASVSSERDRPLVMGIWGAFVPVGMGLSLLVAPLVMEHLGWRVLWLLTGFSSLLAAVVVLRSSQSIPVPEASRVSWVDVIGIVGQRTPLLMCGCFFVYSAQFMAVTAFLPTLLLDRYGLSLAAVAQLGTVVVLANIVGNVAAGWLLRRQVSAAFLLTMAMLLMGALAACILSGLLPLSGSVAAAIGFTASGGLIPGTLFASAQVVVSRRVLAGVIIGLVLQAAGIGQLIGPPVFAFVVERAGGWSAATLFTTGFCALGLVFALMLGRRPMVPANSC